MLEEMTPEEFDEWRAYQILEPFDDGWVQTGVIASTVQNCIMLALSSYAGKRLKEKDMVDPVDFMPWIEQEPEPETVKAFRDTTETQATRWQQ